MQMDCGELEDGSVVASLRRRAMQLTRPRVDPIVVAPRNAGWPGQPSPVDSVQPPQVASPVGPNLAARSMGRRQEVW